VKVKKTKKKANKTTENLESEVKVLTDSNERLIGREAALLEAVRHKRCFIYVWKTYSLYYSILFCRLISCLARMRS